MRISGFTMVRNGWKLYYPIKEAIQSILPICDEFIVALGDCDEDDRTEEEILSIQSDKIKIIKTVWDIEKYPRGTENAHQTDIAKSACTGDWCFYVQADEVVHEKYLPVIRQRCEEMLDKKEIDGLLFQYTHFWGDYWHYSDSHKWYKNEIRIVRNDKDIHSWWSAQSFRRIPDFDNIRYRHKPGTQKLNVAPVDAYIYHYGWVRPPEYMQTKSKSLHAIHWGKDHAESHYKDQAPSFDYGNMNFLCKFNDTHPAVMNDFIKKFNWSHALRFSNRPPSKTSRKPSHERTKYRLISFIENRILGGFQPFAYRNYRLVRNR